METLRCLIADIPQKVLADIVQRVTQQNGRIEVVGQCSGLANITEELREKEIDVLIVGMNDDTTNRFYRELLGPFQNLLIVGLVNDGRMAVLCLGNIGSSELIKAITVLGKRRDG